MTAPPSPHDPAPEAARPLWVLLPGCRPVLATQQQRGARGQGQATHCCREGDGRWERIDTPKGP